MRQLTEVTNVSRLPVGGAFRPLPPQTQHSV